MSKEVQRVKYRQFEFVIREHRIRSRETNAIVIRYSADIVNFGGLVLARTEPTAVDIPGAIQAVKDAFRERKL
jgi:hypothetical protein